MYAGRLDRRLTLMRATATQNDLGETVETWADIGTVWASRSDKANAEAVESAGGSAGTGELRAATVATVFRVRWSSLTGGLTPRDRVREAGRVFDITGLREIGRREGREIMAMARAE